jgi:hypothetical protein
MTVLAPERSGEELHAAIEAGQRSLCAVHATLLADVGECDRVEGWRAFGSRSTEEYLVRHHDLRWPTAKDWVRCARVLARHPELAEAYAAGTMSPDKLAAACRLAAARDEEEARPQGPFDGPSDPTPDPSPSPSAGPDPAPDPAPDPSPSPFPSGGGQAASAAAELLDPIARMRAGQLGQVAAAEARAGAAEAHARWRRRRARVWRDEAEGRLSITDAQLFDDDAAIVWAALRHFASNAAPDPVTGTLDPLGVRFADALVAFAQAYLSGHHRFAYKPVVVAHADARVLVGEDGWAETSDWSPLAAETARRLACACKLGLVADDPDGRPLRMGRALRDANWQQAEACWRRDGGCRRCGATLFVATHHIAWWDRDRGPTDLENLCLLCSRCHHLVHDAGWVISGDPDGPLTFTGPGGVTVTTHPRPPHPPGRRRRREPPAPPPPGDGTRPMAAALW